MRKKQLNIYISPEILLFVQERDSERLDYIIHKMLVSTVEALLKRGIEHPFYDERIPIEGEKLLPSIFLSTVESNNKGDVSIWAKSTLMDNARLQLINIDLDVFNQCREDYLIRHQDKIKDIKYE